MKKQIMMLEEKLKGTGGDGKKSGQIIQQLKNEIGEWQKKANKWE